MLCKVEPMRHGSPTTASSAPCCAGRNRVRYRVHRHADITLGQQYSTRWSHLAGFEASEPVLRSTSKVSASKLLKKTRAATLGKGSRGWWSVPHKLPLCMTSRTIQNDGPQFLALRWIGQLDNRS